jgi:thiol-disulfide isomerase/thioredoxin
MAHIICPKCQSKLKVDDNSTEHRLACPRCHRLIRVSEDGTVAVLGEPGSAKKNTLDQASKKGDKSSKGDESLKEGETATFRLAEMGPTRRKGDRRLSGWIIAGVSGVVVCLLLVLVWPTNPTKPPTHNSRSPFAANSPEETASVRETPDTTPDSGPRAQLRSGQPKNQTVTDSADGHPAAAGSLAKASNAGGTSAEGLSKVGLNKPDLTPKEESAKERGDTPEPTSRDDLVPSSLTAGPVSPRVALAEVFSGKLNEEVGKVLDEWQQAAAKFAVENTKTNDPAKVKSLQKHDPAKTFGLKLVEFGEEQPNSNAGFQAYVAALYIVRDSDAELTGDIVGRAAKHLADRFGAEGMGKVALVAAPLPHPAVRRMLQAVLDKNPHREDRGRACFALIRNLKIERDQTSEPTALKRIDKQAIGLLRRVDNQEFGDVTIDELPLVEAIKALAESLTPQLSPGSVAPEIIGKDLEGNRLKLSDFRGKVVMLEFWAGWCPHCRRLIPYQREFVTKMKKRPFVMLGVNADKKADAAAIQRKNITNWRSWQDGPSGPIGAKWLIKGYPTVFLLDRQGTIRYAGSAVNWEFYDQFIKNLLAGGDGTESVKENAKSASREKP